MLQIIVPGGQTLATGFPDLGCRGCSHIPNVTNPRGVSQPYVIRQSCYPLDVGTCSGVVQVATQQAPMPPTPPTPPPAPPVPAAPAVPSTADVFSCAPFTLTPRNKTARCAVTIPPVSNAAVGTCGVSNSSCTGDTVLYVTDYTGAVLAANNDGPSALMCGACSFLNVTNTGMQQLDVVVLQECLQVGRGYCGGTTTVQFTPL